MSTERKNTQEEKREIQLADLAAHNMKQWSLSSASGRIEFFCELVGFSESSNAIKCLIKIKGDFWVRGSKDSGINAINDFYITLPQVLLDPVYLKELYRNFVQWQGNLVSFDTNVGSDEEGDQSLVFFIGKTNDLIVSNEKPACSIIYKCGSAMDAKWQFIVDQSCISLCSDGLKNFLADVEARWAE